MTLVAQRAARMPITLVEGADFSIGLAITENGVAYPWAGATVVASILDTDGTPAAVTSWTFTPGASGAAIMSLTDTQTTTLGVGTFLYSIEVTKAGVTTPWLGGQLSILDSWNGGASNSTATFSILTAPTVTVGIEAFGWGSGVLTVDGNLLTRAAGVPAEITRANLAADTAFATRYGYVLRSTGGDDTAALNAAIAAVPAGEALTLRGVFQTSGTVTVNCNLNASDATIVKTAGSGTAVVVGTAVSGAYVERIRVLLPKIIVAGVSLQLGWLDVVGSIGLDICNLYSSYVEVPLVQSFETGMRNYGKGKGNVYNTVVIGHLNNNKINQLVTADATGWSNQNLYIGGRFDHSSAEGTNVAGTRHIEMVVTTSPVNNNFWLNPSVEGNVAEFHAIVAGSYNVIDNGRWEAATPKVKWATAATQNEIRGGYGAASIVETLTGAGVRNRIVTTLQTFIRSQSTAFGLLAGNADVSATPTYLTAVGSAALQANTTGLNNTAVGTNALRTNISGGDNSALGFQALYSNTASSNTAVGTNALYTNISAASNTAVGAYALYLTTAANNTAVGYQALRSNAGGISNVAVGLNALFANTSGTFNTAVGASALYAPNNVSANATTTAINQTAVGVQSGAGSTTQSSDITTIGYRAIADGTGATSVGSGANAAFAGSVALGMSTVTTLAQQVAFGLRHLEMVEITAPAAGATNSARIYAVDNGSGKTQLMVRFATGAVQQLAIEP